MGGRNDLNDASDWGLHCDLFTFKQIAVDIFFDSVTYYVIGFH